MNQPEDTATERDIDLDDTTNPQPVVPPPPNRAKRRHRRTGSKHARRTQSTIREVTQKDDEKDKDPAHASGWDRWHTTKPSKTKAKAKRRIKNRNARGARKVTKARS